MKTLNTFWLGLRATLFWIGFTANNIFYGLITPILLILPTKISGKILRTWNPLNTWWLKVSCGMKYRVKNPENIDRTKAHILLANHQSTWETIVLPTLIPPFVWVLKKELFKIPFFGWALRIADPIAIDRSKGRSSVQQIKNQGKAKLDAGFWICIFPEGTRVPLGKKVRYKKGGATLAAYAGYPILPVAHNAGESWPRHSFIKKPGTITISIGPAIETKGRKATQIIKDVEQWIETERKQLPPI